MLRWDIRIGRGGVIGRRNVEEKGMDGGELWILCYCIWYWSCNQIESMCRAMERRE